MSDDQMKYTGIETLVFRGCDVELVACAEPAGSILIDAPQAVKVTEDLPSKTLTFDGYEGKVAVSMRGHVDIRAEDSTVKGVLLDGRLTAGNIDITCEPPSEAVGAASASVPPVFVGWAIDVVGVLVFAGFYVFIFALLCKVFGGNPVSEGKLSWALVLGAGTYFGYTGHSVAAAVLAILSILTYMYYRAHEASEAPKSLSDYVAFGDFVKIGVFLGIMLLGKLLRDYIESYKRGGWTGLRNRLRR